MRNLVSNKAKKQTCCAFKYELKLFINFPNYLSHAWTAPFDYDKLMDEVQLRSKISLHISALALYHLTI